MIRLPYHAKQNYRGWIIGWSSEGRKNYLPPDEVEASRVVGLAQVVQDVATLVLNVIFIVVLPEWYVFFVRNAQKNINQNFNSNFREYWLLL